MMTIKLFWILQCTSTAANLHRGGDRLALGQDLGQILSSEYVAQRGLGEQAGGVVGVLDVGDRHGSVADPVVDDGVDGHRHRVLGQHLPRTAHKSRAP